MHRFYISPENWDPRALILRDAEAHHARDVLRLKPGDRIVVFNGRGREVTAEIIDLGRDQISLRKLQEAATPPLRCPSHAAAASNSDRETPPRAANCPMSKNSGTTAKE